ncbi:helix-turn-helix domain-containing protein [uncultured Oscillibacter sp.]|uniref:helix-turn-helix domain-containing protein n=1 Tax=uncultured Oscillibacter sp. TaxID=876091 RepID=UPI00260AA0F9|nr:helix-turn-helix transcriptional regulator [uncultured Oscillibacter sp.]
MPNYSERLKELRTSRRLYQRELAELLGISIRGYQCYETGEHEPGVKKLIALADYYNVSIDYLVGRTDDPSMN